MVVAEEDSEDPVVEPDTFEDFGAEPTLVRLGAGTLFLSFCCEPAEGLIAAVDLATGTLSDFGVGVASSATAEDVWLRVLTNGMQVSVEAPGAAAVTTAARDFLLPSRSALAPGADLMAVLGVGAGEDVLLAMEPGTPFLEDGVELARGAQNEVTPNNPVIDAAGRVWYVEDERVAGVRNQGVIVDAASGEVIERFEYPKDVLDQDFDGSGQWLIVVFEDGTLGWRSMSGESGELPGAGWITADW